MWRPFFLFCLSGCFTQVWGDLPPDYQCYAHYDCPSGYHCSIDTNTCISGERINAIACQSDLNCLDSEFCSDGLCTFGVRDGCAPLACASIFPGAVCTPDDRCLLTNCEADGHCPTGQICNEHRCVAGERTHGARAHGSRCDDNSTCSGGHCFEFGGLNGRVCSGRCDHSQPYTSCGDDAICLLSQTQIAYCYPRGKLGFGAACESALDCYLGVCLNDNGRRYCTSLCRGVPDLSLHCPDSTYCDALPGNFPMGACRFR